MENKIELKKEYWSNDKKIRSSKTSKEEKRILRDKNKEIWNKIGELV